MREISLSEPRTPRTERNQVWLFYRFVACKGHSRNSEIVNQECFNSPYGHVHFPKYAEKIDYVSGKEYDTQKSESESVKMLADVAREAGIWLIGGSIPERAGDGNLYNTATVYSPEGSLVAIHRKAHLFDINIPGKITFEVSWLPVCMQKDNNISTGE
jgi:hypothetical protein